jgi:CRISPR-associated protein Csb1
MFEKLGSAQRLLMEVDLRPVQGSRFQPTGFADLGAAVYERPDGMRMLLVESAQSMANRLEHGCLSGGGPRISPELEGLPYIVAELSGDATAETSSLVEAHRINSPYIISDRGFQKAFIERAACARGKPLDWRRIAGALLFYDPNSLLHGAFLANLEDGRVKIPRALTAFIEAEDVREAVSGGVKNNPIDPSGSIRAQAEPDNVYGNVPFHRIEYTARKITAYFNLDLSLIAGYGIAPEARDLLIALGLYKIRRFLDGGLRLRTACDLCPKGPEAVTAPEGFGLPAQADLLRAVQSGIKACAGKGLFAEPPVTVITTKVKSQSENSGNASDQSS